MAKRIIKRLDKTGRISYQDALAAARKVHAEMKKEGKLKGVRRVTNETTATGRGAISFHIPEGYGGQGRSGPSRKSPIRRLMRPADGSGEFQREFGRYRA